MLFPIVYSSLSKGKGVFDFTYFLGIELMELTYLNLVIHVPKLIYFWIATFIKKKKKCFKIVKFYQFYYSLGNHTLYTKLITWSTVSIFK